MSNNFRVGQKVICVDDRPRPDRFYFPGEIVPKKGEVYTVRSIEADWSEGAILLDEITNVPRYYNCWGKMEVRELAFRVCRFRPVVERKTDISVFQKLLEPNLTRELVCERE